MASVAAHNYRQSKAVREELGELRSVFASHLFLNSQGGGAPAGVRPGAAARRQARAVADRLMCSSIYGLLIASYACCHVCAVGVVVVFLVGGRVGPRQRCRAGQLLVSSFHFTYSSTPDFQLLLTFAISNFVNCDLRCMCLIHP